MTQAPKGLGYESTMRSRLKGFELPQQRARYQAGRGPTGRRTVTKREVSSAGLSSELSFSSVGYRSPPTMYGRVRLCAVQRASELLRPFLLAPIATELSKPTMNRELGVVRACPFKSEW